MSIFSTILLNTSIGKFSALYYDIGATTETIQIPYTYTQGDTNESSITGNPTINIDHDSTSIHITEKKVNEFVIYGKSGKGYRVYNKQNNSFVLVAGNIEIVIGNYTDSYIMLPVFYIGSKKYYVGSVAMYMSNITQYNIYNAACTQTETNKLGYLTYTHNRDFKATYLVLPQDYNDAIRDIIAGATIKRDDPYIKGDITTGGGGGGTFGGGNTIFGGASDSIDIPPLPSASASSAGFITLFNPSLAQLNNLANYMWSDLFSLDTFKKIFADPMDCILGLSIVPVKPASAGTSAVKIGNVSTDVSMNKTSSQYVAVDCGTIDVKEYWGAYLDYEPYTQCEIYLPYVGTKQISVDDVMNKAVHVVYHVDILSGACNAYVKCGTSVLYTFVGQCSSSIPISGNDWTNVLNGAISVAGKIGLAMATGGATALMSGLGAASSIISSSKPTVERSGAMSSTGGLLGIQKPYLILTRPKQALPENQNKYTGYPSFITMALSDCTGYTEVDSIHLDNMSCTDEEAQEIENLLKSGVIF